MTITSPIYVGIDVSNDTLEVARLGKKPTEQFANTKRGIAGLVRHLKLWEPKLIVVEATGGYEETVVWALFEAGLPVALVSPQRVRQYAKAKGLLAKTDQLDAHILADFGKHIQPRLFVGKGQERRRLSALVGRRNQLNTMLQAEKNRLQSSSVEVKSSVNRSIAFLKAKLKDLDAQIHEFMNSQEELGAQEKLLRTAKSVGPVTASALVADLPELGQLDCKQVASLVGVAPMNKDSGKKRDYRKTKSGRPNARNVLYMSTLNRILHNPGIQAQYVQLVKRGKEKKVAITACMRKVLVILTQCDDEWPTTLSLS